MPAGTPTIGMFGIKLVGAIQPEFPFFGREGKPPLMNFPNSPEGRHVATAIPIGHRSLVYLMHPVKRFWAAIEYVKWDSNAATASSLSGVITCSRKTLFGIDLQR